MASKSGKGTPRPRSGAADVGNPYKLWVETPDTGSGQGVRIARVAAQAGLVTFAAVGASAVAHDVATAAPGVTATEMNDRRLDYDAARLGKSIEELEATASPLGRRLTPDEIAPLAVFLASDAAAGINGQCINVCGGTLIA